MPSTSETFESILARDGKLVYKTRGYSMLPMLRQNRDLVILRAPVSRLRKYDVALYRRGQSYVLHRVIGVEADHYRIRGDNTYNVEIVPDSAVIGVLTGFTRDGKQHQVTDMDYRLYARVWCAVYPLRAVAVRVKAKVKSLLKKMLRRGAE